MRSATRQFIATFGALVGLIGIEHGIGEVLQGNVAPSGLMILSWPESSLFSILGGEPAMTILPSLLGSGILTILFSTIFLLWAILFVHTKQGGLVLILLSMVLLLVGGGIFPPIFGVIIGLVGISLNARLSWLQARLPVGWQHFLIKSWPWSFSACLIAWLGMFPGTILLWHFFGVNEPNLIFALLLGMFGFFLSTVFAAYAHDIQEQAASSVSEFGKQASNERRTQAIPEA
jgi:hypothetical protein